MYFKTERERKRMSGEKAERGRERIPRGYTMSVQSLTPDSKSRTLRS